jgi:hypothetical protein
MLAPKLSVGLPKPRNEVLASGVKIDIPPVAEFSTIKSSALELGVTEPAEAATTWSLASGLVVPIPIFPLELTIKLPGPVRLLEK